MRVAPQKFAWPSAALPDVGSRQPYVPPPRAALRPLQPVRLPQATLRPCGAEPPPAPPPAPPQSRRSSWSRLRCLLNCCSGWGGVVVGLKVLLPWLLPGSKVALLLGSAPLALWLLPLGTAALLYSGWLLFQSEAGQRWEQARQVIVELPQRLDKVVHNMSAVERGMHFGMLAGAGIGLVLQGPLGVLTGMAVGAGLGIVSGCASEALYQLQRGWARWRRQDVRQLQRWDASYSYAQQLALYTLSLGLLAGMAYGMLGVLL